MTEIAAGCPGMNTYVKNKRVVVPVPDEFLDYYVPVPWQERLLPVGAYTSLWPRWDGKDWNKTQPEGWGPDWRPKG
jgi:hypothetical protein